MSILHFYTIECPFCLFVYPVKSHSVLLLNCFDLKMFCPILTMLLNSMLNTDNAAQLYAQYRLCCSTLSSILTMLLNSMLNTHYAAQLYAQYWQCCPSLCSIPTMLLNSMLNTRVDTQVSFVRNSRELHVKQVSYFVKKGPCFAKFRVSRNWL